LIAATIGRPSVSRRRSTALFSRTQVEISSEFSRVAALRSLRSPPAKNVFLAEVMITPVMVSRSASRRSTLARIDAP
jgi:hypothetical protein